MASDPHEAPRPLIGDMPWLLPLEIGAKVVTLSGYAVRQPAEVVVPRVFFARILERIPRLGVPPPLAQRGSPPRSNETPDDPHGAGVEAAQKRSGPLVLRGRWSKIGTMGRTDVRDRRRDRGFSLDLSARFGRVVC
jgi:hypothetical protein